jgi:hypothetical protein
MDKILIALEHHPFRDKFLRKLTKNDLKIIESFLNDICNLDKNKQHEICNRMFLDKEKPKNCRIIQEICSLIITL